MILGLPTLVLALLAACGAADNGLPPGPDSCEVARVKCAYRTSCAMALHSYMVDCADVLAGRTARCPWACKRALVSLTSSEPGLALTSCDCGANEFCRRSKERAEVCRPEVTHATADHTVVACSVAEWICAADPLCSTALQYYHRLCRPLFHGRKCTPRCNNSLAILDRQEKASKLRRCYCDGSEDFPCISIKKNTQKLCYGRDEWVDTRPTKELPSGAPRGHGPPCAFLLLLLCALVLSNSFGARRRTMHGRHRTRTRYRPSTWPWWWSSERDRVS